MALPATRAMKEGGADQQECIAEPLADQGAHRQAVGARVPQVAMGHRAQPLQVADDQGIVQPVVLA